jgi:hypothetical protein
MQTNLEWWRVVLILVLLGGLVAAWLWLNRSRLSWNKLVKPLPQRIKLLDRNWLNSKTVIYLLEIDGQKYLLASSGGAITFQRFGTETAPPQQGSLL